jgi:hypothetical protein
MAISTTAMTIIFTFFILTSFICFHPAISVSERDVSCHPYCATTRFTIILLTADRAAKEQLVKLTAKG